MYHRFCGVTGRLALATNLQAPLNPIRPIILQSAAPSSVVYDKSVKLTPITVRHQSSSKGNPVPERLKKRMELFQADNDVPVHLKGGPMDVLLYRFTAGLAFTGLAMTIYTGLDMAMHT